MNNFDIWFSNFKLNIADYNYYVDYNKVYKNVSNIESELSRLESIVGSKNIKEDFLELITSFPDVIKCIPALLAVRENNILIKDKNILFDGSLTPIEYTDIVEKFGLLNLLKNLHGSVYDYALGIEVGLDTNGRKGRGGELMSNLVEDFILKAGYVNNVNYFKEMSVKDIKELFNIDLTHISSNKRFDYVIKTNNQLYVIETNFYKTRGSKLNEVSRSYSKLSKEIDNVNGVSFMWITDGAGWSSSKNNLKEAYKNITHLYNINDLENGLLNKLK